MFQGYIQLESTSIEQVVNVWHQQILHFLVLDDRIDLDKILKAGVKLLVADVSDNKVDRLAAVVVIVEVKQELSIVLGFSLTIVWYGSLTLLLVAEIHNSNQ
jgi:hypothetical protein